MIYFSNAQYDGENYCFGERKRRRAGRARRVEGWGFLGGVYFLELVLLGLRLATVGGGIRGGCRW